MHAFILADLLGGLGVNLWGFLSQLVSFGVIFFVLWRWALPIITRTLSKRQEVIQEGINNAERARHDLEEATKRAEELLLKARRDAQETIANAEKIAQEEQRHILEEARIRAEEIGQQQIARIQQEAARARADLQRLVVNLSIAAASQVIKKSVDTKDNRRLVEEFVSSSRVSAPGRPADGVTGQSGRAEKEQ
jgi:F-type H+-transporting ATPase subunit b